ncbi:peroxiredoxin [Halopolyspora algeriensis]|uniref:Peroxiredoxin n=1 Tax=Halopolyspora algeriensis TaxID=1500506 RepID=A0A368W438_9ACTN|nr:MerR family transcriptional regulator [Halopolyspora algeriensis]RCW46830.1 peroxiredoxin [Halopolyspora algeriensis]TQM47921.1 peroxiredoxin [Halopolyspora algeriensis]
MRIGEVATRAGVTTKAVRYYESLGLITPSRLANGYRDYSAHDLQLVREIRDLNQLGIPVERTRPFLECLSHGEERSDDCPASLVAYRDAISELTKRITALTARRRALAAQLQRAANRTGGQAACDEEIVTMSDPDVTQLPQDLPRPVDDGAADHLPGQALPHLTLPSTTGEQVSLETLGLDRTILYLYPLTGRPDMDLPEGWDAIPGARGCTSEACDFRDHHAELREAGASRVFGISSQSTEYQREVVQRLRLPFAMLSDSGLTLADVLNLPTFDAPGMTLYKRLTLVIRDSTIEHAFYPIFPPNQHAQEVLVWLRSSVH